MRIETFVLVFLLLVVGVCLDRLYLEFNTHRFIDGFYYRNSTYFEAQQFAKSTPNINGDWVCVDVQGMTPQEAFDTCKHETGHEIFAEYCENNIEKCLNLTID